jgi:hypothetical protein
VNITSVSATDQPIATEIRRVIIAEPALTSVLPQVQIRIESGVVTLSGNVGCPAEGALIQTLIRQQVPRVRVVSAFAPAGSGGLR